MLLFAPLATIDDVHVGIYYEETREDFPESEDCMYALGSVTGLYSVLMVTVVLSVRMRLGDNHHCLHRMEYLQICEW